MNARAEGVNANPRFVSIVLLDGNRIISQNYYGPCAITHLNKWGWIADSVSAEFECAPDHVSCIEDEEAGDLIAVDGAPVAYLIEPTESI